MYAGDAKICALIWVGRGCEGVGFLIKTDWTIPCGGNCCMEWGIETCVTERTHQK